MWSLRKRLLHSSVACEASRVNSNAAMSLCRTAGEAALRSVPPEVAAVLSEIQDDEGSSSEDTSDELYLHMHHVVEQEEQRRYAALAAGARGRVGWEAGGVGGVGPYCGAGRAAAIRRACSRCAWEGMLAGRWGR